MDPSESEDSDVDSLTPSLEAAMPPEQRLSTQERLRLARRRRSEQLKKWGQREREWQIHIAAQNRPPERNERVTFVPNVMLLEAAARNDLAEVRRLLESGVSPDSTNEDGLTALHQCCIDDSEEMMKLLIQYGGNPNATDTEKWTPLHAAATCGHLHLVKFLIDAGAELLSVNADGNMPYDLCEDDTTLSYIENEMARRGVTQELIDDTRSNTERHMYADLLAWQTSGGDLETRDPSNATPLHIASANGYLSVVEFLLDHHASTEVVDDDLWQPLHAAACWGHLEVVEMLAQNGANINAKTRNGETPYDICEDPDIKERLLELKELKELHKLGQPRVRRTRSASTRTQSIRRTSLRDKMNTTKRDVQDEKLYFIQSIDGQKATSNQGSTNANTNGHNGQQNGDSIGIGTTHILEKEAIDIKDVELTLLPSYLHNEQESVNVIDNTDLLQSISKPNPQLSPPKRPPRSNHSPEVPLEKINVQVNVNGATSSSSAAGSPISGEAMGVISGSGGSGGPQTLADLKKQRSMHRVAQHGSSPVAQGRNNQNSSDRGHISSQSSQQYTTAPQDPVAAGNGHGESGATGSGGGKKQQHRTSSSPRSKSKHRDRSSGTSGADEDGGGGAERRHKSGDRGSRSKNGGSSGRSRGQGQSGGQQGQPGQQQRNNSSRKKFAATEVVGPSPKKVGCCRVM